MLWVLELNILLLRTCSHSTILILFSLHSRIFVHVFINICDDAVVAHIFN